MRAKVWIALGTIYVVWGSTFLAIAVVVRDLPPFLSMSLRHLVAGALLFGWVLLRHRDRDPIGWRQWRAAFVFGGALFLLGHGLLAWAQQDVPSGIAALLVGTIPLWFAILAWIFMGERLGRPGASPVSSSGSRASRCSSIPRARRAPSRSARSRSS